MDTTRARRHVALTTALVVLATTQIGAPTAHARLAPRALTVVAEQWIVPPSSAENAAIPSLTRAANGDIVLATSSGVEGSIATVRIRRSSDDGQTWSAPTILVQSAANENTNAAVGMTTLSNGTILLPFTVEDLSADDEYTRRFSKTYVARSYDNGITWDPSSIATPISLPSPWNGADVFNATYGRIVDLGGGTLLMPVWGTSTQTPKIGATRAALSNPVPSQAGVLRSTDNGATWSTYSRIGVDANSQVLYHNYNGYLPTGVTEPTIVRLRDGRLMAMLRYDTVLMPQAYLVSYSSDGGYSWTDAVKTPLVGRGGTLDHAPCSSDLVAGRSKLAMAYLEFPSLKLRISSSFDNGAQWKDPTTINRPAGSPTAGYDFYPDLLELPGNRVLVVYTANILGTGLRLGSTILQDSSAAACQSAMTADDQATASTIGLFVKAANWAEQPWHYSSRYVLASSTTAVGQLIPTHSSAVACTGAGVQAYKNGALLNPALSFAANGVVDGDTIEMREPTWTGFTTAGYADVDGGYLAPGPVRVADASIQHKLAGFSTTCDARAAFDHQGRSVGARFAVSPGEMVTALHIRDSDSASSIPPSAFTVWKSPDNATWYQVPFTYSTTVDPSGRQVLHFTGLNTAGPYLKVNVNLHSTSGYQVIINSMRNDVWVSCNVAANGCPQT